MKAALSGNIKRGQGYREFEKTVDAEFDRAGLTRLSTHQIQNIYETNVSLAYAGGQMQKMVETAEDFPFWKYSAVLDGKTRPKHAALHGKIFRTGDFTFFPPLDFRCRCTAILLTARQAGRYPKDDMPTGRDRQKLYDNLESKAFAGSKQQKFMEWIAEQYKEADQATRKLIDQAFDVMKEEIRNLEYESAKEFFRDADIKRIEKEFLSNTRVQKAGAEAGLTKADTFRTYAYTDFENGLSADMARLHYGGELQAWDKNRLATFKKDLTKAVSKLPKVEGVVYRNLDKLPADVVKQFTTPDAVIEWDGFSSTTKSPDVHANREVRLVIHAKTARDIESVSKDADEKEALLLPGTRLKVVKSETVGQQVVVTMEEI
ncbi:MAG: minor capsid protein [Culturomica sp.]|jgi:SPP1 gp7 family putative phage head morphogenesis protein|nr:minor capsid protein [Culturomica sp.]